MILDSQSCEFVVGVLSGLAGYVLCVTWWLGHAEQSGGCHHVHFMKSLGDADVLRPT